MVTANAPAGLESPAWKAVSVTPDDDNDLADGPCRALYIGGTGSGGLTVTMLDGDDCTFAGLAAGTWAPIRVTRVKNTGTDVTAIVALY